MVSVLVKDGEKKFFKKVNDIKELDTLNAVKRNNDDKNDDLPASKRFKKWKTSKHQNWHRNYCFKNLILLLVTLFVINFAFCIMWIEAEVSSHFLGDISIAVLFKLNQFSSFRFPACEFRGQLVQFCDFRNSVLAYRILETWDLARFMLCDVRGA